MPRPAAEDVRHVVEAPRPAELAHRPEPPSYHLSLGFVMREIGAVVRLQIQRSSLKTGEKPHRVYDPSPVLSVRRLAVDGDGVLAVGEDQSWIVAWRYRSHPQTRNP